MNNPFNPSFGKVPPIYIDRGEQISDYISELKNPDSPYQTALIYGQRGSGKTAFMSAICNELSSRKDFIVLKIPASGDVLLSYVQGIYDKSAKELQKSFDSIDGISVSVLGVQFEYNKKDNVHVNYQNMLEKMLKKLAEKQVTVVAVLDEIKATEELKKFIEIYKILLESNYPVRLIMAGLPQYVSDLQNDAQLTFLLRAPRIITGPLDISNIRFNYKKAFENTGKSIDDDALSLMVKSTGGYAYAFQLMGYLVWKNSSEYADIHVVKAVLDEYKMLLYRNAYTKISESFSQMDKVFVIAMAHNKGAVAMKKLVEATGKSNSYLSNYRARLLDDQVIQQSSYGYVGFCLPFFREFVLERLDE